MTDDLIRKCIAEILTHRIRAQGFTGKLIPNENDGAVCSWSYRQLRPYKMSFIWCDSSGRRYVLQHIISHNQSTKALEWVMALTLPCLIADIRKCQ